MNEYLRYALWISLPLVCQLPEPTPAQPKLVLPARVHRIVDGDTLDVVIPIKARIRLLDCWAPEKNSAKGRDAAQHLEQLSLDKPCLVDIPIGQGQGLQDVFSFGRVLAYVEVDGQDLSEAMITAGHAVREKP